METTILSRPNGSYLAQIKSSTLTWWGQTGQKHWQKWGIWVWIVVCFLIFILSSNIRDAFFRGLTAECDQERIFSTLENILITIIALPLGFGLMVLMGIVVGRIHYALIFEPILKRYRTTNVILYLIVCLLVYDLFLADFVFEKLIDLKTDKEDDLYAYGIWAFSLMFSIIYDYKKNEDIRKSLEKERNKAQIQALKAQINPHFLFNTLNNLYGTALVEESPKTADGIQQLAQIMRHAVESSQQEQIDIGREIRFLHDYIELQQIRLPKRDTIRIRTDLSWDEEPAAITPLILMTFVENAFKYGINPAQACFVELTLTVERKQLTFVCRNSIVARTQLERGTGMGVEITLKRLNLLYPNRHTVRIHPTDEVYEVFLTIQLS